MSSAQDKAKREAARAALDYVEAGMSIGLGTGSTAAQFVRLLGEQARVGLEVRCVPTSEETAALAREQGLELMELRGESLDLAVDGADEIGSDRTLIKGGGGALLREKIVAEAAKRFVVIADMSKRVEQLGDFPLPVEVMPFGVRRTRQLVLRAANHCAIAPKTCDLRRDGQSREPILTDGGHFVLDLACGVIPDATVLAEALLPIPGVVEHGLFIGMADTIILGEETGVQILG